MGVWFGVVCLGGVEVEGGGVSVVCHPRLGPQVAPLRSYSALVDVTVTVI